MIQIDDFTVIILDTNILNHIFTQQIVDGKAILSLLKKYKENIWIPFTVYSEYKENNFELLQCNKMKAFKKNSADIKNEYEAFIQKMCKLRNNSKSNGFFEWDSYLLNAIKNLEENLKEEAEKVKNIQAQGYSERLTELINGVNALVDELYTNGQVGKPFTVQEIIEICNEGKIRYEAEIPPGYSDDGKNNGYAKYNDLFIWKEIIRLASSYEKTKIIFLTDDMKEGNWWINSKSKENREISPMLKQEFYELCPSDYEEKKFVEIIFQTLSDFMQDRNVFDFSLVRMNKSLVLDMIKQLYLEKIQDELYDFVFNIDPMDIIDMLYHPNNAGEILYEDLIIESDSIEEVNGLFCCQMTVSQEYEYNVAYEDNEGDIFNFGNATLQLRAMVTITNKNKNYCAEKVLFLNKDDCDCIVEHINYEIVSCKTFLDYFE